MRQNTLSTAVAALLPLHAIPIKVLVGALRAPVLPPQAPHPRIYVDIRYNTPDMIEGDFEATTTWGPAMPSEHRDHFIHDTLEDSEASELAECYLKSGTWDRCGYPSKWTVGKCYCGSWRDWTLPIEKEDGLYKKLLGLLKAKSSGHLNIGYEPIHPEGDLAARISLGDWVTVMAVYDVRLARDLYALSQEMSGREDAPTWFNNPPMIDDMTD